jgi:hypothetical protein
MDKCPVNPWAFEDPSSADPKFVFTLEWLVGSPPAFHTFHEVPLIKDTVSSQIKS